MTETFEMVGSIRRSLTAITDHYDATLIPHTAVSTKLPSEPAKGETLRYAPKAMKEAPPPIGLHILDTRRDALTDLQFWARFIMGEVRDVNNKPIKVYVDATNIHALCAFVATWADRIVADHPDDAANLADDAAKHAARLEGLVAPPRRDWMALGPCPLPNETGVCGGQVRAYPDSDPRRDPECKTCGTVAALEVWMAQIQPDASDLATAGDVIACIALRTRGDDHEHVKVTHDQLWQWVKRGKIQRHGKDAKGRTLYSKAAVLAYARDKQEEAA